MSTWREKPTSPDDLRAAIESYGEPLVVGIPRDDIKPIPPRVRRNYTQGANGLWRAEFTVESYHDPLMPGASDMIAEEDEIVGKVVCANLAALNYRGKQEAPVPT